MCLEGSGNWGAGNIVLEALESVIIHPCSALLKQRDRQLEMKNPHWGF